MFVIAKVYNNLQFPNYLHKIFDIFYTHIT